MKVSRRTRLADLLERHGWPAIGEPEFQQILAELAPIPENELRRLLRESGVPLAIFVEGVRQSSLAELERTLEALASEYAAAVPDRRRSIRRLVITARDHARLAARRTESPAQKQEMILWMNTWLENPGAFALWAELRRAQLPAALTEPRQ